jgi:amicoumacin kinase
MIPVPQLVIDEFARCYGTQSFLFQKFGGGRRESDGIVYAYPYGDSPRLLKIMATPIESERAGLFCLDERLRFMRYLGENGAFIAFPLLSPASNLYETFRFGNHVWVAYCMDIAPGSGQRPESWDIHFFQNWGRTIGMLHRLAESYPSWQASIDPESGEQFLSWREEWGGFYNWCQDKDIKKKWVEIKEMLEKLPVTRQVFGFIHNDPHVWNLLVLGERVTVLDFDVANHHWFINDIAIASQSILLFHSGGLTRPVSNRTKLLVFLQHFMRGYEQEHHLPLEWIDLLDIFIAYRRILYFIITYSGVRSTSRRQEDLKKLILAQPEVIGSFS